MLQCNVHARPYGVVYWERGGVKITNSVKYQIDAFEDVGGYFVLTLKFKISHQSDYGEYVCEAANLYGMHQSSVELIGGGLVGWRLVGWWDDVVGGMVVSS